MNAETNERLGPLVKIAYRIYRGEINVEAPQTADPKPPISGWSEEAYREGLEREIEEKYSSPPGALSYLTAHVRDGSLSPFTEQDCATALGILDAFLREALFIESSLGDGRDAAAKLEAEVPGLPKALYADVLGYYAYINR